MSQGARALSQTRLSSPDNRTKWSEGAGQDSPRHDNKGTTDA